MYTQTEEELNLNFSAGGEHELKLAIDMYGVQLFRYAFNLVCDYQEAQDIVELAFIRAYQNRDKYPADTLLSVWLYRITYTTCMNHLRKRKWSFSKGSNLKDKTYEEKQNSIDPAVISAMLKLKPLDRAIVYGRTVLEHDYSELEKILNISQANLKKRFERAKAKLALYLQQNPALYRKEAKNGTIGL